jgi:hypothetical protein
MPTIIFSAQKAHSCPLDVERRGRVTPTAYPNSHGAWPRFFSAMKFSDIEQVLVPTLHPGDVVVLDREYMVGSIFLHEGTEAIFDSKAGVKGGIPRRCLAV